MKTIIGLVIAALLLVTTSISAAPLYLIAELGDNIDVEELKDKFGEALKYMKSTCDENDIDIELISYAKYKLLSEMAGYIPHKAAAGQVTITPDDFEKTKWKLKFGNPNQDIGKVVIKGKANGQDQEQSYEGSQIGAKGEEDKAIWLRIAGEYNLTLPHGFKPTQYKIDAVDLTTGQTDTIIGDWPELGRYCRIELPGDCVPDATKLKKILEDEDLIGEPITLSDVAESVRLYHASIGDTVGKQGPIWNGNTLRMVIDKPKNRSPKRVWMAFPLTKKEAEAKIAQFKKANGKFKKGSEISAAIRQDAIGAKKFILPNNTSPLYTPKLNAVHWYEMPRIGVGENATFEAMWQFDQPAKWRNFDWRVYVYEFQRPDGGTEAVSVIHPDKDYSVRAVDEKFDPWVGKGKGK